jgi:hypothetical protein
LPEVAQLFRRPSGIGRHEDPVERTNRGADNEVRPDAGLSEGTQHADLMRAHQATAAKHERRTHASHYPRTLAPDRRLAQFPPPREPSPFPLWPAFRE